MLLNEFLKEHRKVENRRGLISGRNDHRSTAKESALKASLRTGRTNSKEARLEASKLRNWSSIIGRGIEPDYTDGTDG
jgi:hypothetical protein